MTESRHWQYPESRILVFAKAPRPGEVKTRLAETIGAEAAAQACSDWLEELVARLDAAQLAPLQLWVSPDTEHPLFQHLAKTSGIELHTQPGGDLGQRMHQVMLHTLAWHDSAVLIGSDCPVMSAGYVRRALAALESGIDTVLGPAEDGGYVLLGMRSATGALFTHMPWSTPHVLRITRQRLVDLRRGWAELETLWDVDTHIDYARWLRQQAVRQNDEQQRFDQEVRVS
jgi:uncharacterized protein